MTCRSDRGRSASAVDLRHGFLVYRYFMTAPMLFSRIRGVKVGYSVKVEREVGTGGSPARHGFLVYRNFMTAAILHSRSRSKGV